MPKVTAKYYVEDEFLGESVVETVVGLPHSFAYFCTSCGRVWARIHANPDLWFPECVPCAKHRPKAVFDWEKQPGSILAYTWSKDFCGSMMWAAVMEFLPSKALVREFRIHHDNYRETHANILSTS